MASVLPGGPQTASYTSLLDPATGRMKEGLNLQVNQTGNNMLRQQALSSDFSPWAKIAMQNQATNQMGAREMTGREQAQNALAMQKQGGGPMGALNLMRQNMSGMQATNKAGTDALMKLKLQDQADRSKMLTQQVQNDLSVLKPEEMNITNALNQKSGQDLNKHLNWQEHMKAWAATEQAKAQINSGKK